MSGLYFSKLSYFVINSDEHNTSEPLFLYMPHQAIHVSANKFPVEAPQEYIDMFAYIESDMRRGLAAAAYSMDESIGAVVERLHSRQMLENSIIIFMSDNGGTTGADFCNWIF